MWLSVEDFDESIYDISVWLSVINWPVYKLTMLRIMHVYVVLFSMTHM